MKILTIEDDDKIVAAITFAFKVGWPGTEVVSTDWGQEGISLVEQENPDAVLLDLGLPDIEGFKIISEIRKFSKVPILVLTARTEEAAVVQALEMGANDYICKPFRQMEMIARVKRIISWSRECTLVGPFACGSFEYNPIKRELVRSGKTISLTSIENAILEELIRNAPGPVSPSAMSRAVWGDDYSYGTDSLKVHIRHLRQKVENDPRKPRIILTKTGCGYFLAETISSLKP